MRKSSVWAAVLMMAALVLCSACTKHDYPSCTDSAVTKIVLDKTITMSRDLFVGRKAPADFGLKQAKGSYDALKAEMENSTDKRRREASRKILAAADKFIADMTVELKDVTLNAHKGDDTSWCDGSLVFTNTKTKKQSTAHVQFSVRYTEDHKLDVQWDRM